MAIKMRVLYESGKKGMAQIATAIKEKYELPEAYDMTTEAVAAKIMWVLPKAKTSAEFKELFLSPIGEELL